MKTQLEKGHIFRELHKQDHAFIIPNPWDVGTARLLASLGFEALATTSAGYAFSAGRKDGTLDRGRMIAHIGEIAAATDLPVSADLENGYGTSPTAVEETFRLAASSGVVGGSIEDATGNTSDPIFELERATERVQAASAAISTLPFTFTLTARAENYLHSRPNLKDTITMLQAYQEAGAEVLYAPGLARAEDIAEVVRSVDRPVNVVMGLQGVQLSLAELSLMGVRRVSVGGALARTALGAFLRAGREMREHGTFQFAKEAVSFKEISAMFES